MDDKTTGVQTNIADVADTPPTDTGTEPVAAYDGEAILPENWKPESDGDGVPETSGRVSPEDENLFKLFGMKPDGTEKTDAPESTESVEPKPENAPEEAESLKEESAPDYKAMYEALLHSTQDNKNRDTFRRVYAEQKAAGMSDAAARLVAKDAAGGKEFSLTDEADASGKAGQPDYAAALNQLHSVAPELKEVPAEVTKAIMDGGDAVSAYMGWQRAQDQKTIGELQAKIADMEKKAANTVQAVARGVSASGAKQNADDDFLKGMMAEDW